jgi:hypothetical protein
MRRRQLVPVLLGLLLATACGTTVPLTQQQSAATTPGLSGEASTSGTTGSATTGTAGSAAQPGSAQGGDQPPAGQSQQVGGTQPGSTGGSSAAPVQGTLPTSGRGWDAKHIYIGVPTIDDFNATIKGAGAATSNGNVEGDVDAIVADINKSGGLLGRQLVAVYHDAKTTDVAYNSAATAQAMCTYFTQDRPVIAVLNGAPQFDAVDNFHTCLEHAGVSLLSFSNSDYGDQDYARLGPHLWTTASLSTDILVPSFVRALARQHFFTGWDTLKGAPGTAPVKVGILLPDTPQGRHVDTVMRATLRQLRLTVTPTFFYNRAGLGSASQSEVLQLKSAGVTHVLDLPPIAAEIWLFQSDAEQQHFRPRYGFTSFNLPLSVEENSSIVPAAQQVGSMGIGWQPYNDSNAAHDPGPTPGRKRCLTALSHGGQSFNSTQRRGALIGAQFCDAIYLVRDAAVASGGLTGAAFLAGMPVAGPRLAAAGIFRGGLSKDSHGLPGYYRDQQYSSACSCFVYSGADRPFSR